MNRKERITEILNERFRPARLEVVDESAQHKGHAGWNEAGETHFRVRIASSAFAGKTRVETHRLVNDALAGEIEAGLHALAIEAKAA